MVRYSLDYINQLNENQTLFSMCPASNASPMKKNKYKELLHFLGQTNQDFINRNSFGQNVEKSYFKKATTPDEIMIANLNGIMSKITENNCHQLLEQFKELPFDTIKNLSQIVKVIHSGVINCSKFNSLFVSLFEYISQNCAALVPFLRDEMLNYDQLQMVNISELVQEEKLMVKNNIMANYDMMTLLLKSKIVFNLDDILNLLTKHLANKDAFSIELAIRLTMKAKQQSCKIPVSVVDQIKTLVAENRYPNSIKFLIMDLN